MNIYTKKGDSGETSLLGGKRVRKSHSRIMAYGTIDELNSHLGLVRSFDIKDWYKDALLKIQKNLFNIGARLSHDPASEIKNLPEITESDVVFLEKEIDEMEKFLPELTVFIIPGGSKAVGACHVARSVARRAERVTSMLDEKEPVEPIVLKYLNRLADYLFVLARSIGYDDGVEEIKWK
jgi:cob(I)alamin adenosyltransferase